MSELFQVRKLQVLRVIDRWLLLGLRRISNLRETLGQALADRSRTQ